MKHLTMWRIRPENMTVVIKRFQEADPRIPGVKLTRFHVMGTGRGFSLTESSDSAGVSRLASARSDLVEQETVAVVVDAEMAAALK